MNNDASVQRRFGESAALYAKSGVHATGTDFQRMLHAAELDGNERVLDLGTGTAHTALAFAPHAAEVIGLDLTQAMLDAGAALAKEQGIGNLRLQQGNAQDLPFDGASFDIVMARQCPHHFTDPGLAVREAARVLKPGGKLLILDSISLSDPKLDTFMNAVEILRDPSHVRNHSLAQWRSMFEDAGLDVLDQDGWLLRLEFEDWIKRGGTPAVSVAQLRHTFETAPSECRLAYEIDTSRSYDFSLPVGITVGRR